MSRWFLRLLSAKVPTEIADLLQPDLDSLLVAANPNAPIGERIQWLADVVAWVRVGETTSEGVSHSKRLHFLTERLEQHPIWRKNCLLVLASILRETEPLALYCETGLSPGEGLFSEALERILRKFIPAPRNDNDLRELFRRVFLKEDDADWLAGLTEKDLSPLFEMGTEELRLRYGNAAREALIYLSSQVQSLGLSQEIRFRSHVGSVRESAFFRLHEIVNAAANAEKVEGTPIRSATSLCRKEVAEALAHLEEHGVSVAIVFRLELMERILDRIDLLAEILFAPNPPWSRLAAEFVRATQERNRVGSLVQDNFHLLARKIVERTGASGEEYITTTVREYVAMLLSAAGGGLITAFTTVLKFFIKSWRLAPFFDGFFVWINYAGSFLLMQAFHFTLATKQPSMTAPALASKIKGARTRQELEVVAEEVARMTRSQFAAAIGNLGALIPMCFLIDFCYRQVTGTPLFSVSYSRETVQSLDPTQSILPLLGVITGIVLWLSSVAAGWAENWFVYRRIPEALSQSGATRLARWMAQNINGVMGNVALGFLLAFTPVAGKFFGLPIDAPHMTLSSGALAFSIAALGDELSLSQILFCWLGVAIIGVFNFGVSFAAALWIAVKATSIRTGKFRTILQAIWRGFRAKPARFFFPPAGKKA